MATLGSLASGIRSITNRRRGEAFITELGDDDRPVVYRRQGSQGLPQYRKFQYFPESLTDTKGVQYQTKEIPGGSIPLYQYINSGEHNLAFTAIFTTDIDHLAQEGGGIVRNIAGQLGAPTSAQGADQATAALQRAGTNQAATLVNAVERAEERLRASGVRDRSPFVLGALIWLRRFMLPRYGEQSEVGVPLTKPPHKLLLHFTGSHLELLGGGGSFSVPGGGLHCIMTQCDITVDALFPSGNIRQASVNLTFSEVPQNGGVVRFPSASPLDELAAQLYRLTTTANAITGGVGGTSGGGASPNL
jgi:hypothetical protein